MSRDSTPKKLHGPQADPAPSLNRHADFNWLWLGQSVSVFGTQISMLAIPLTAVLYLRANAA